MLCGHWRTSEIFARGESLKKAPHKETNVPHEVKKIPNRSKKCFSHGGKGHIRRTGPSMVRKSPLFLLERLFYSIKSGQHGEKLLVITLRLLVLSYRAFLFFGHCFITYDS